MSPQRNASTLTPPHQRPPSSTEIAFPTAEVGLPLSGARNAVARRAWTRARVAWCFAAWDFVGIATALIWAWSVGWVPGPLCWVAIALGPGLAYVFGAFSVPILPRPWTPALAAAVGGGLAAVAMLACGALSAAPLVALVPVLTVGAWPAVARIFVGRTVRLRLANSRWLIIGTPEALTRIALERARGKLVGECQYLVVPGPGVLPDEGVIGSLEALGRCLPRRWTGIVVTAPEALGDDAVRDLMTARLAGTRIYDLAEFWEAFLCKVPVLHLRAGWVVLSHGFQLLHDPISLRLKRASDLLIAAVGLVLAAPLMLLTALAVRLTSPGPVLFRQERVGARGVRFIVLKFRTMRVGSESGDKYTLTKDPRITFIGSFLRKSRLDELPQLWNILRGDMSFIGPRAEWIRCVESYESSIPFYHLRHVVKPGLTGWAQVNYPYGASVEDAIEKLQYDLWYIKHHSLFLDLRIILKTVRVVVFGMGR